MKTFWEVLFYIGTGIVGGFIGGTIAYLIWLKPRKNTKLVKQFNKLNALLSKQKDLILK